MTNKINIFFLILIFSFTSTKLLAEDLNINAEIIKLDKKNNTIVLKKNVLVKDEKLNEIQATEAIYNKNTQTLKTIGKTKIKTSEGYLLDSKNIIFDNIKGEILSYNNAEIIDKEGNKISSQMFKYDRNNNLFFSKGDIELLDKNKNIYKFSEIYINEKEQKIVGSDIKVFLEQDNFKIDQENDTRIFANSVSTSKDKSELSKGILTFCKYRENGKCPPWSIQARKINHDVEKKTIYYTNAVLKIYDVPVLFTPKFAHPDPSVKRRSGFLIPELVNNSTLGSGLIAPYFVNLGPDRDITLTPKLYVNENPLMLTEYRRDFENSFLIVDAGYTEGYKRKNNKKTAGGRNHLFSRLNVDLFSDNENLDGSLEFNFQKASNHTYFKIYDINTALAEKDKKILENNINFELNSEDDFLTAEASVFEDLSISSNKKYEYIFPHITYDKNLVSSEKYGFFDLRSNLKFRNFETDKTKQLFVNDFNWKSKKWASDFGLENQLTGTIKTVNYESKNVDGFKNNEFNSEISSAVGLISKLPLLKIKENMLQTLTPKLLFRYSPTHIRDVDDKIRLNYSNIFKLNRIGEIDVLENGLSATYGFEYKYETKDTKNSQNYEEKFSLSVGQIINEKENKDLPAPLNQKISDTVGQITWKPNDFIKFRNNYSIDQNYKDYNYNELNTEINLAPVKFNFSYLEEQDYIGKQEFIKSEMSFVANESSKLSFSTKRNLLKDSSEYYNLSYEYFNDCLRAGLFFRREFYTDKDIEPDNSLMFKITLIPFGDVFSPKLNK